MHQYSAVLSNRNIDKILADYLSSIERIGDSIAGFRGIRLLEGLKRGVVGFGPYPDVTLFEAANRIMTDLVILFGVRWLLRKAIFPFDSYAVEYGNENKNGFDIRASTKEAILIGEAFNVALSFFQIKKSAMLKKLRTAAVHSDFRIVMSNNDAVLPGYVPELQKEFMVIVDVTTGKARIFPERAIHMIAATSAG
jgi:hypothetical protein